MKNVYSYRSVEQCVYEDLEPMGYEIHVFPGVLVDSFICIAPDEQHYNFIFWEEYLNEWSAALTCRRCQKLPKWALAKLEEEAREDGAA